ncbi:PD-(D/E)XK nuclease family protein [Aeromicrobium sp. 179-A 4D2 NHS]|uniref:RecB family exonuclease n=1 Tax=Aeromicrobium sp. 179-A 4D2 NHS TaxID=3142375 RepID=UPI0039A12CA2
MSDTLTRAPEKTEVNLPDVVAWDNDHLVILDHAITEQVERKALSPSTSKSMASCRARWLADRLLPDNDDRFAPAPLGTSGHLILERFYDLPPAERTSDRLMLLLLENADEEYPVIDEDGNPIALDPATVAEKQRWIGAVYDKIQRIFEMEAPQSVSVRQTEMPIDEVEIAGVPFNGHIDRVDDVFDENGNYIGVKVIDYKTGNPPKSLKFGDDHGDQMRLYKLAYEAKYGVTVVEATLYYTAVGKVRNVPISKAALNKTLKAFVASWKAHNDSIAQEAFITKPTPLCGWCPLVNSCPSAIKDDGTKYVPKAEGIPTFEELPVRHLSAIEAENAPVPDAPADVEFEFDDLRMLAASAVIAPTSGVEGEQNAPAGPTRIAEPVVYPTITGPEPVEFAPPAEVVLGTGQPGEYAPTTQAYEVAQPVTSMPAPASDVIENGPSEALTPVAEPPVEVAARTTRRGVKTLKENTLMTQMFAPELDKPWDPRDPNSLPPNAPDATALFGLVNTASEIIADNGYPLDKTTLRAMSGILAKIVADAELAISGRIDWASGLNTRLRGALHSHLSKHPMPVGTGDNGELIEKWMSEATESIILVANTVVAMFTRGLGESGAHAFTTSAGAKTFAMAPQTKTDEPPF